MLDTLWLLVAAGLIFLMQPGFMCLEAGLIRAKNSANVAVKNFVDFGISTLLFWAIGYAFMFGAAPEGVGGLWGQIWQSGLSGWIGWSNFAVPLESSGELASFFVFQVMFCSAATTIISGAVAERLKFPAYILVACLVSGFIYPIFGHWVWHGVNLQSKTGWLGQLGFVDFAGAAVVHSVGGWTALAILLIIGPREGRFAIEGAPTRFRASNLPLSVLGTFLIWVGWLGFNGGNTLAFTDQVASIIAHTVMAGAAGMIASLIVGWPLYRGPEVSVMINGSLGGLVAITASCHVVTTGGALVIGAIGGAIVILVDKLLDRCRVDDAIGAVAVHAGAGVWGTLAVALVGHPELLATGLTRWQQLGVQSLGGGAAFVWSFGVPYLLLKGVNRWRPLRVSAAAEASGLDVSELHMTDEVEGLFKVMEVQAQSQDLSLRVPIEPFTEVGRIAERYNQVMDALEEAVTYTDTIVRTATDAILTFRDEDLTILTANPSAERIFGYAADRLIGLSLYDLVETPGRIVTDAQVFHLNNPDLEAVEIAQDNLELTGKCKDGSMIPLEGGIAKANLGQRSFYTGTFRDVSDRKHAELQRQALIAQLKEASQQLQDKNQQLEQTLDQLQRTQAQLIQNEKMESLEQMVGGIAHEFNNPINFILGNVVHVQQYSRDLLELLDLYQAHYPQPGSEIQAVLDEIDLDFIEEDLPKILISLREGSSRIRDIVRSLRIFSRLDEADLKSINLHDNIDSTLLLLQGRLRGSGGMPSIELVKQYIELPPVECYPRLLNQACLHIISNAIDALETHVKATATGSKQEKAYKKFLQDQQTNQRFKPCIWISTHLHKKNWVTIEVRNNGPAIPIEIQSKIFDPFFTTKPVGGGVGLGLAESYQIIVDQHGGQLSCCSHPESDTTFVIEIPVSQSQQSQDKAEQPELSVGSTSCS